MVVLFSCKKDESTLLEPSDTFVKYYGDTYLNEAHEMINTSDGGFIMAGETGNASSKKSMFVVKVGSNGNEEWTKTYSNTNDEVAKHITLGLDGGYLLASTQVDVNNNQTIFFTKIGASGDIGWRRSYFINDSTSVEKVITTSDNEYLILANTTKYNFTNSNPSGKSDVLLMKLDVSGNFLWSKQYGGNDDEFGYDLEEKIALNGYVVVGSSISFAEPTQALTNAFIFQTNSVGTENGKITYGGTNIDIAYEVEPVSDGYLICGETQSNGNGDKDVYLFKVELNIFSLVFEKYFGGPGVDIGNAITSTSTGDFLIGATTNSIGNGANDAYLIKTDANGNELFVQTYGSTDDEKTNDIISLTDNKIIMLGSDNIGGNQMITLTKTKEDGSLN